MPKKNIDKSLQRKFIKVYINANIGTGLLNDVLLVLCLSIDRKTNRVSITADTKKEIALRLHIKPVAVHKEINRLIDKDLLQRCGTGSYMLNPVRMSRGYGVDFLSDNYLDAKYNCEKSRKDNDIKYKLNENRGKKKDLPGNILRMPNNG